MNVRQANIQRGANKKHKGSYKKYALIVVVLAIGLATWLAHGTTHASSVGAPLKSGWTNYCLDDYRDKSDSGNQVDIWPCNDSAAQNWTINMTTIKHSPDNLCLTVASDTDIDLASCSSDPNQVWLRDSGGYVNPNSGLCLTAPSAGQGQTLNLQSCNNLTTSTQSWTPAFNYSDYKCSGDQGQLVACYAIKQWINWQSNPNGHEALLSSYTGGAAYEEWCADFVSYIYQQAGYPFSSGNYDGWDENIASQIQNQGFTIHQAGSGYIPQPGDVAFFDYPGGHVEIVVSGGKNPTFIYGNSNTIDPTTDNGEMATNTILSEAKLGQVEYYMSPNSST